MSEQTSLASTLESCGDIVIPAVLRDSVARHQKHLAALILSFRSAGLDEALIDASVHQLVSSYETELRTAIKALVKAADHV